jgi:hypothetical protein
LSTEPHTSHSSNGAPQPQSLFSIKLRSQMKLNSPPWKKPSTCPNMFPNMVLPLRPNPATYNTLTLFSATAQAFRGVARRTLRRTAAQKEARNCRSLGLSPRATSSATKTARKSGAKTTRAGAPAETDTTSLAR